MDIFRQGTTEPLRSTNMASQCQNSDEPENLRKIFLGGLNRSTTKEDLKAHFEQFGTVCDSVVIMNSEKESKGFGFVTMSTIEETDKSLRENNGGLHEISKKKVEVKRAIPRDSNIPADPTNQIFVKNLGTVITDEQLKNYFSQFSSVKSAKVIKEKGGEKKSRGFGFVEFDDNFAHHAVDKIAIMDRHSIEGRTVYCSKAEDRSSKEDNLYGRYQGGMRGGYMGRNTGRGSSGYGYDGYGGGNYGGNYSGGRGYSGGGYGANHYGSGGGGSYGGGGAYGSGSYNSGSGHYGGYGGGGYGGGGGGGYGGNSGYGGSNYRGY